MNKPPTRYVSAQIRATSALVGISGTRTGFLHLTRNGSKGFVIPKIADGLCLKIVVDNESIRLAQQNEDPFVDCVVNQISFDWYRQIPLEYRNFGRARFLREKFGDSFVEKIIAVGAYWYFMRILSIHPRKWGEQFSKSEPITKGEQYIGIRSKEKNPYGRIRNERPKDYFERSTQKIGISRKG